MSKPLFFRFLLALALAWSGGFAQLHALSHAQHDLAAAVPDQKAPPPLKHATDQCLVVHAFDGSPAETASAPAAEKIFQRVSVFAAVRDGEAPAAAFRSRAPPLSA